MMLTLKSNILQGNIQGKTVQCGIRLSPPQLTLQAGKYRLVQHGKSPMLGLVLRLEPVELKESVDSTKDFAKPGIKVGHHVKTPGGAMSSGHKIESGATDGSFFKFLPGRAKFSMNAGIKWGNVGTHLKMVSPESQMHKDGGETVMAKLFYNPMDEPGAKMTGPADHKMTHSKVRTPASQPAPILVCAGDIPGYRALVAGAGFGDLCAIVLTTGAVEVVIDG